MSRAESNLAEISNPIVLHLNSSINGTIVAILFSDFIAEESEALIHMINSFKFQETNVFFSPKRGSHKW